MSYLIESTRAYLREFLEAIQLGDAQAAEERMLAISRSPRQAISVNFHHTDLLPCKGVLTTTFPNGEIRGQFVRGFGFGRFGNDN